VTVILHTPSPPVCPVVLADPSGLPVGPTVLPQPHMLFCQSVNFNESDNSNDDEDFEVQQDVINDLSLSPDIDQELDYGNEFSTADTVIEEEDKDSNEELPDSPSLLKEDSPCFLEMDNLSMKIVLFPKLKDTIESNFCCKICMLQ